MAFRRILLGLMLLAFATNASAGLTLDISFDDGGAVAWTQDRKDVVNQAVDDWENAFSAYDVDETISFGMDFRNEGGGVAAITYGWSVGVWPTGIDTRPWSPETGHYMGIHPTSLWWDPTPETDGDVPGGVYDALTVIRHELGHLLGVTAGLYFNDYGGPGHEDAWADKIVGGVFDPGGLNVPMTAGDHTSGGLMDAFVSTGTRYDVDQTMDMIAVAFDLDPAIPVIADTPANASFESPADVDILNIDFGTFEYGDSPAAIGFDLNNLMPNGTTADLDLVSITPTGDSGTLMTDLSTFTGLEPGDANSYEASMDTSTFGAFSASYELAFTDEFGTNQTMTLNLSGDVEVVDHPDQPNLIYDPVTGDVVLDATGSAGDVISIYSLKSAGGFFEEYFAPFLGSLTTETDIQLGEGPDLAGVSGVHNIGPVFPTGMDLTDLHNFITEQTVVGTLGSGSNAFDLLIVSCSTGDSDCDGDVDLDDVIAAVGSFTGPCTVGVDCYGDPGNGASAFNKTRADGDVNNGTPVVGIPPLQGDGDVDLDDIIDMVGAFTGPSDSEEFAAASAGDAGLPDLIYDSLTGEVTLDAVDIGGTLQAYNIKNADGLILNANFTPILGGAPATDLNTEIGEFQLSATPTAGGLSIGFVFPVGMDQAQLEAFVTGGSAAPSFGGGSFAWELIALNVGPEVPEPATVSLLAIGLLSLALVGYRRRRS